MGFATLVYNASAATAGASNVDFAAATDANFSTRNSHYIFSEPYKLGATMLVGASVTGGRFQSPTLNAIGEFNIMSANRQINPPSNPQWDLYGDMPPPLPMNEEFQLQGSNNLGSSTEIENGIIQILSNDWSPALPRGVMLGLYKATFTVTPTLNAWSADQAITMSANLRAGVYAVVGAALQGDHAAAFRINFPRQKLYMGRKLLPGGAVQKQVGDVLSNQRVPWQCGWGEWGRFFTFELPLVEVFGVAAVSTTYTLFLWLVYLGEDPSLMNGGMGGGSVGYSTVAGQNIQP